MKNASLAVALFAVACSSPRAWVYAPAPRQARAPLVDASLVVPPLIDARPNENTNAIFIYLVPLMPFGYQDLAAPESVFLHPWSASWQIKPSDDFARAFAQEIDAARIFRESFNDPRASSGDYRLTGEIVSMAYDAKLFSYCLSVFGPLLWFFGFPAAHVENGLEIRLQLAKGSGPAIWSHTLRGQESDTGWLYGGGTDFMYDTILKAAMPATLASLEAAVRAHASTAAGKPAPPQPPAPSNEQREPQSK